MGRYQSAVRREVDPRNARGRYVIAKSQAAVRVVDVNASVAGADRQLFTRLVPGRCVHRLRGQRRTPKQNLAVLVESGHVPIAIAKRHAARPASNAAAVNGPCRFSVMFQPSRGSNDGRSQPLTRPSSRATRTRVSLSSKATARTTDPGVRGRDQFAEHSRRVSIPYAQASTRFIGKEFGKIFAFRTVRDAGSRQLFFIGIWRGLSRRRVAR